MSPHVPGWTSLGVKPFGTLGACPGVCPAGGEGWSSASPHAPALERQFCLVWTRGVLSLDTWGCAEASQEPSPCLGTPGVRGVILVSILPSPCSLPSPPHPPAQVPPRLQGSSLLSVLALATCTTCVRPPSTGKFTARDLFSKILLGPSSVA